MGYATLDAELIRLDEGEEYRHARLVSVKTAAVVIFVVLALAPMSASADSTTRCVTAEVTFSDGEVAKGHLSCGPRGWSKYVESVKYTRDLDVIRESRYGPDGDSIIGFHELAGIRFKDFNEEERRVIGENVHYRYWVRKAELALSDGAVIDNVYLLEICYLRTSSERLEMWDPDMIMIRLTPVPGCK